MPQTHPFPPVSPGKMSLIRACPVTKFDLFFEIFLFFSDYWVGLWKQSMEYYWDDCIPSSGEKDLFTEITKYTGTSGCGFIESAGATVSMAQCDIRKGFICEYTDGKKTDKNIGLQLSYVIMMID